MMRKQKHVCVCVFFDNCNNNNWYRELNKNENDEKVVRLSFLSEMIFEQRNGNDRLNWKIIIKKNENNFQCKAKSCAGQDAKAKWKRLLVSQRIE